MYKRLTDKELVQIVTKLINGEGSDEESSKWISILERNTGCPKISDYIFWSGEKLTPEEIIEKALNYKAINTQK